MKRTRAAEILCEFSYTAPGARKTARCFLTTFSLMKNRFVRTSSCVIAALALCGTTTFCRQQDAANRDTLRSRIFPLPIFFYTPETGIAGGAAALYLVRTQNASRPSSVTGDVIYTEKKQVILELNGDIYFSGDDYRLLTSLVYQKYPNKFFGVGNNTALSAEETYTPRSFLARAVLYCNVVSRFNVGPAIRYGTMTMVDIDRAGLLAPGNIPGSIGGTVSGIGFVANWDSRDNTFAPYNGSFYQLTATNYQKAAGGDFSYTDIQLDTRNYLEILPRQILAFQFAAEFMGGTPPFQNLVQFGGQNILRGYFAGRYRDKNGIAAQADYRLPVWWRFGLVGFLGAAQVAPVIDHFALNRFWIAGGVGLRFFWNPEERISLRLDYGVGNNSSGLYITVTEAF